MELRDEGLCLLLLAVATPAAGLLWVTSNVQFAITGGADPESGLCSDLGTDPDPDAGNRVPESGALALLALGFAGVAALRRRAR